MTLLRPALLTLLALALLPSTALAARNVTIVAGTGTTGFPAPTDDGTTKTYSANADDATIGADTLAADLATRAVVVNTGSDGFQVGTLTVSSAVSTAPTATKPLTLAAANNLTINAQMTVAGQLHLNTPLATTINQPISPFLLLADAGGENFINADISAVGEVYLPGQSNLGATITSVASEVDFLDAVYLTADSTVNAGTTLNMTTSLDGAYSLTVVAADTVLGAVGTAIFPTDLSITGPTTLFGGSDTVTVTGALTFNGDVDHAGSLQLNSSTLTLGGTLTAGSDVTLNPSVSTTLQDGASLGSDAAPLTSLTVNGLANLGNSNALTTGAQNWNGPVVIAASKSAALTASTGQVALYSTIDGPGALTIDPGSSTATMAGAVGSTSALSALTVLGAQALAFTGGMIKADAATLPGIDTTGGPSTLGLQVASLTVGAGGIGLSTHALTVTGGGSIAGPITGFGGSLTKSGTGTLVLTGTSSYESGTTVTAGELRVNGSIAGDVNLTGGLLSGTGTIGGAVGAVGAAVSPGASPGTLTVGDNFTLDAQSAFDLELQGATAGSGYDQLIEGGHLTLGGAVLQVTAAPTLPLGQPLTILSNTSGLGVDGTFAGKPEGSVFDVGAVRLQISYVGGDGNDVTLTRVKQPSSLTLASGPASVVEGSPVTLTATLSGPAGTPSPTGTVTFKDGATVLGTAPVSGGVATLTTSALGAGDHTLGADFSSDFYEASSGAATQRVDAKPPVAQTPPPGDGGGPPPVTTPAVTISVAGGTGNETRKPGFVTFVVKLSRASDKPVTVEFATKNGTAKSKKDFRALQRTLTFRPGQTKLLVKVRIVDDKRKEKTEKFTLVLSGPVGATLARTTATGTIHDND